MKNTLTLAPLLLLLLTGCLENETPCTYNRHTISLLTSGEWNVDTFHVFVYDSVSLYKRDTTYLNDGTMRFYYDEVDCSKDYNFPKKTISFQRSDGKTYSMNYTIGSYGPYTNNLMKISSTDSLDGFDTPYNIWLWWWVTKDKLVISYTPGWGSAPPYRYFNYNLKYVRYWEFVLSKK